MRKPVIRYKVVRSKDGKFISAIVFSKLSHCLTYSIGIETKAPTGGCLVFKHLGDACLFIRGCLIGNFTILKCDVRVRVRLPKHCSVFRLDSTDRNLIRTWQGIDDDMICNWPHGTEAYKYIKPIEIVR